MKPTAIGAMAVAMLAGGWCTALAQQATGMASAPQVQISR
jgi:hypothetical protein